MKVHHLFDGLSNSSVITQWTVSYVTTVVHHRSFDGLQHLFFFIVIVSYMPFYVSSIDFYFWSCCMCEFFILLSELVGSDTCTIRAGLFFSNL